MSFVDTVLTLLLNFQKLESWLSNQFFNVYPCHHDLKFVVISALQSGVKLHHYLILISQQNTLAYAFITTFIKQMQNRENQKLDIFEGLKKLSDVITNKQSSLRASLNRSDSQKSCRILHDRSSQSSQLFSVCVSAKKMPRLLTRGAKFN